ncbi:CLUMA_CG020433, isoform A [Clunio marinus]|uniref:CLUMA_CG020433, isoform A n=1 Tax=Clunio marinus TaxID=568069 RepID=A0A1J1J8Z7_9DIPT|nr:CLUMA_CG020433, isoform A [Clunio marinus]
MRQQTRVIAALVEGCSISAKNIQEGLFTILFTFSTKKKESIAQNLKFSILSLRENCENIFEISYCNVKVVLNLKYESFSNINYDIQPIYIIHRNSDGKFQSTSDDNENDVSDALANIDLALKLTQCVISTKFNENRLGERSFALRKCEEFYSNIDVEEARKMNQWELYDEIAKEILNKNGSDVRKYRKFVAFVSCTLFQGLEENEEYSYSNIQRKTLANPALGGGFLCLMGSGSLFSYPKNVESVQAAFQNKKKVDLNQVLDDSNYRKTYGGCFSTSLGSLIHEIGHIFDLAHTESGLMGDDIDYVHRFFLTELFTEVLPKRSIRCQINKDLQSKFDISKKFTILKKPGGTFLEKYHQQKNNDMTFFEQSCLVTLWNHKWFTQSRHFDEITFNHEEKILRSKDSFIRVIEIRELEHKNRIVIKSWIFSDINLSEFSFPKEILLKSISIFAISSNGVIYKEDFN